MKQRHIKAKKAYEQEKENARRNREKKRVRGVFNWMARGGLALVALFTLTAMSCTPEEVEMWRQAREHQMAHDCYGQMREVWPAHLHGWAKNVIHRESRGQAGAQNSRSSAAGCFQLIHSLHAHRYAPGCSRYHARCNVEAAWDLYQDDPRAWRFSA